MDISDSTQQATSKGGSQEEEAQELNRISDSLKSSQVFKNVHNVLQCNTVSGKRFHRSITIKNSF